MSNHQKHKPSDTPAASDPPAGQVDEETERMAEFIQNLPPADLDLPDEELFSKYREHMARKAYATPVVDPPVNFWDSIASNAVAKTRPVKIELTPEEERGVTDKVFERFELRGRMAKLEELIKKAHDQAEARPVFPSVKELRCLLSISKRQAALFLRCTPRTIYNYVKSKKLKMTPKKRIICDDNLIRLYRNTHGDSVLR